MANENRGVQPKRETLTSLLTRKIQTTGDVLSVMRGLDALLEPTDGLKWFNLLYIIVTEHVEQESRTKPWSDSVWLERLDVVFANLYFGALSSWMQNPGTSPHAWRPLFQARQDVRPLRLQFALAGMNAHINRDLCRALVDVARPTKSFPGRKSGVYADFTRVNQVLERAEKVAAQKIATGIIGLVDEALGDLDNIFAMWSVRKAREAAWINAEVLWQLQSAPFLADQYFNRLDRMTGFAGRGLLQPVLLKTSIHHSPSIGS
jgi:hypothetical protein